MVENVVTQGALLDAPSGKMLKTNEITTRTIKSPYFAYINLELISRPVSSKSLDDLTIRRYLSAALSQFLGLMGSAISIDILKAEGQECWIRTARQDLSTVVASAGGWIGNDEEAGQVSWRVKAAGNWLGSLVRSHDEQRLWE